MRAVLLREDVKVKFGDEVIGRVVWFDYLGSVICRETNKLPAFKPFARISL